MAKDMLLKDILPHIDFLLDIILVEGNSEVYRGSVLNIPWIYADFLLDTNSDGEAISTCKENEKFYLTFYIKENPDN